MKGGIGSCHHCAHPQLYPEQLLMSSFLLKSAEKENICCMAAAHASPAAAQNFLMKKNVDPAAPKHTLSTTNLSWRQVAYIVGMSCVIKKNICGQNAGQESPSDQMFEYLQRLFQVQAFAACITMPVPTGFLNPSILLL